MGYERNDRRYGRDQYGSGRGDYGRSDGGRSDYGRSGYGRLDYGRSGQERGDYGRQGGRDYGRAPQGYDYDNRGFFDRAGDEVRSWFGDEEAERRRELDERYREREEYRSGRDDGDRYGSGGGYRSGERDEDYATRARRGGGGGYGASRPYGANSGYAAGYGQTNDPGDYGAGRGSGATGSWGLGSGNDRQEWGHDPNYRSWRDRQIADLDRDYDEYRREHQSKFENEFSSWRGTRQTQRQSLGRVQEHQEVVGSDGQHVGTVDKVRGDQIILTKNDQDAGGHHHAIPSSWVQSVDDKVTISKTADQAKSHWRDVEQKSAFGKDRDDDRGGTNLNRSFSGTYRS